MYEYDVIIIYPQSYSHFIFGSEGKFSSSDEELWELKKENNSYDLDSVYDSSDREAELNAAIKNGTRVIWLLSTDKRIHFFGWRSLYMGYANSTIQNVLRSSEVHFKKSKMLSYVGEDNRFREYFEQLHKDGWRMCISHYGDKLKCIAHTPEKYCLGGEVEVNDSVGWLLTAPTSQESTNILIISALGLETKDVKKDSYHGIFLSHTSSDKPFVRKLKNDLEIHGVENIWIDEAEIEIGDSLTKKSKRVCKRPNILGGAFSQVN